MLSADARKADIAERILGDERLERVISAQVVNEYVHTARRRAQVAREDIRFQVETFREACVVTSLTDADQDDAFEIAQRYRYDWFDSLIVAAAINSGASVLLSEDPHAGQRIGTLEVSDPFAE